MAARLFFVHHLDPELLGLGELAARVAAGDDDIGFLRDRTGDLRADPFEDLSQLGAGEVLQSAG